MIVDIGAWTDAAAVTFDRAITTTKCFISGHVHGYCSAPSLGTTIPSYGATEY